MARVGDTGFVRDGYECLPVVCTSTTPLVWRFLFADGTTGREATGRVSQTIHDCVEGTPPRRKRRAPPGAGYHLKKTQPRENPPPGQLRSTIRPPATRFMRAEGITTDEVEEAEQARRAAVRAKQARLEAASAATQHATMVIGGNAALLGPDGEREILRTTKSGKQMSVGEPVRLLLVEDGPDWMIAESSIAGQQVPPHLVEVERNGLTRLLITVRLSDVGGDDVELMLMDRNLKLIPEDTEIGTPDAPPEPVESFDDAVSNNDLRAASAALGRMSLDELVDVAESVDMEVGESPSATRLQKKILREHFPCSRCEATGKVDGVICTKCEGTGCHATRFVGRPAQVVQAVQAVAQAAAKQAMPAHVAARLAQVMGPATQVLGPGWAAPPAASQPVRPSGTEVAVTVRMATDVRGNEIFVGDPAVLVVDAATGSSRVSLLLRNGTLLTGGVASKSSVDPQEIAVRFSPAQGGWSAATLDLVQGSTRSLDLPSY